MIQAFWQRSRTFVDTGGNFARCGGAYSGERLFPKRGPVARSGSGVFLQKDRNRAVCKVVVTPTFGGGARDQETFAPEGQENFPIC